MLLTVLAVLLTSTAVTQTIFFNHAGASPSPDPVVDRVIEHMRLEQQVGGYTAQAMVQVEMKSVYEKAAQLIGAKPSEIALVESATVASTRLFYSFVEAAPAERNIILLSQIEYAATAVAAVRYAQTHENWQVHMIPSKADTGKVDLIRFASILEGNESIDPDRIALICVTHIPTNSGVVNPVEEIGEVISKYNEGKHDKIRYLCDTCQSLGHIPVNINRIKCDGLIGTGRKYIRGPRGTGILFISSSCDVWPFIVDHNSVPVHTLPSKEDVSSMHDISKSMRVESKEDAAKFEFWESNTGARLGLGVALDLALTVEKEGKSEAITSLARYLYAGLQKVEFIHLYYPPDCGIVTFTVDSIDALKVQKALWITNEQERFELSVVPLTSTPLDSAITGAQSLVRASLSYTNTKEEIDLFIAHLRKLPGRFRA